MATPLRAITLRNMLSFGPDTEPLELRNLNVLVGPNGSGKSNLLEALSLLKNCSGDLRSVIRSGGGVNEWIWKGDQTGAASIDALISNTKGKPYLRHHLGFRSQGLSFTIDDERIEDELTDEGQTKPRFYYRYQHGAPVLKGPGAERKLGPEEIHQDESILGQRKDPFSYPQIAYIARSYNGIRLYREWTFGRNTVFRQPQPADMRNDRLEEDFSNLGLFLNRLRQSPKAKAALLSSLRDLYEGLTDFELSIQGGTVQVFFTEGDFNIPATRLSDGSVRYLCLLAILHDPTPPPIIGIEEPELGLHPDLLPKVADLLIAASQRTQLIVTTHSDILIDALTDHPESVVICEKHDGCTTMRRLDGNELKPWLEKYRLGQLWSKGELGGNRW